MWKKVSEPSKTLGLYLQKTSTPSNIIEDVEIVPYVVHTKPKLITIRSRKFEWTSENVQKYLQTQPEEVPVLSKISNIKRQLCNPEFLCTFVYRKNEYILWMPSVVLCSIKVYREVTCAAYDKWHPAIHPTLVS